MKTKYEEELENRIASLETKYGYLKETVDGMDRDVSLEQKIAAAREKLAELKGRGDDAWVEVKERGEELWVDLEAAFEKLKRRAKDKS